MLSLRRKISDALGGGASATSASAVAFSPSASSSAHDAAASLPAPLVITSAGVASASSSSSSSSSSASPPPSMSAPVRIPEPAKAPSLSMATLGSPRAASPAVASSPLHQHQPLAPRRASVAWVPDALADKCYQCAAHFGLMVRRHHCRRCGNVFCDACSQARMPLVAAGFLTPVRVCDKCGVAAKRAHARLVDERQQQWRREQTASKDKRHRLRSLHSDESVAYDEPAATALFPPPRGGSASSSTSSRRLVKTTTTATTTTTTTTTNAQSRQFLRSQTVKHLYGPPLLGGRTAVSGLVVAPPRQFFADPYGDVDEDEEERHSLERRAGLADGSASSNNSNNEVSVQTLPGEVLLVRSEGVRCRLMNQLEETEGTLYVTSFRLVFSPTIDAVPEYDADAAAAARPPVIHQAIPLGALERLKRKEMPESDMGLVDVVTKDFRHVQLFFPGLVAKQTFNQFDRTVHMIRQFAFNEPSHATEPFVRATATATAAAIAADEQQSHAELPPFDGWKVYNAAAEFRRMGVGADAAIATPRWRLTDVNDEYELCGTYPALLAVPASVGDQVLSVAAKYRSKSRIPVLSWRDTHTGAVICRSSQPLVGLGQRQCDKDVFLIQAIAVANPSSSKFVIIDARPWKNAVAQKTVGRAGYELTEHYETRHSSATSRFADMAASSTDFGGLGASSVLPSPPSSGHTGELSYDEDDDSASSVSDRIFRQMDASLDPSLILTECKLIFMGIENIHTMRRSYNKLLDLCIHKPTDKWVEHLGSSRWIEHISKILDSAVEIVRIVHDEKSSVLVHCSDGWDRTPQLTSLAQLMMDSYYRTIDGFQVLIEKEWCSFGHKFRDRSAHGMNPASSNDISPVFLQFIDCVWQIFRQFPCAFEFNEQFLMLILDHLYSCRFGTFMFDSEKERRDKDAARTTISLWTYIASLERTEISNPFYIPPRKVHAVSLSEAAGLLSPLANAVNAPDLDEVVASALPANPSIERDERDEDEERNSALSLFPSALHKGTPTKGENEQRNSAMNLFPSALQNGTTSSTAPIKIPASEGSTAGSITPPSGLDQSPTLSPQSPALSPSARRSRAVSLASSSGANGNEMNRIPGLVEEIEDDEVLRPCVWSRSLQFWTRYYLRWDPSTLTDRVGSVWIETAHRELQERLEEAERQLQTLAEASQDSSDRGSGVNLPELVQTVAKSMGEEAPMTATVTFDVIEKLEALEQRKREALARIEKEFEEEAAKLLKPTMERPATAAS